MPARKRPGRPAKPINWRAFETLCEAHGTVEEIAAYFDVDVRALERKVKAQYGANFSTVADKKRGRGKLSLRRKQIQLALKGDRTMLIWCGKNLLGQSDRAELTGAGGSPLIPDDHVRADLDRKFARIAAALGASGVPELPDPSGT